MDKQNSSVNKTKLFLTEKEEGVVSLPELQFIFSQSEKKLIEGHSSGAIVLNRSTIILGFTTTLATTLIGLIIASYSKDFSIGFDVCNKISFVYLFVIMCLCFLNIKGHAYKALGTSPLTIFHGWYFETYPNDKDRLRAIMIKEIKAYQDRIDYNKVKNKTRWSLYNISLAMLLASPLFYLIVYIVVKQYT